MTDEMKYVIAVETAKSKAIQLHSLLSSVNHKLTTLAYQLMIGLDTELEGMAKS